jgi:glycosyltransferase involved in cell wall biosynthesis
MAQFYHAADAYVAPYRAEGFNLPVLEACACGTPSSAPSGPTDDFMKEDFTLLVHSDLLHFSKRQYHGYVLERIWII